MLGLCLLSLFSWLPAQLMVDVKECMNKRKKKWMKIQLAMFLHFYFLLETVSWGVKYIHAENISFCRNFLTIIITKVSRVFFFLNKFIYLFIYGCIRSSLLCTGFLYLWWAGATLCCGVRTSHCGGFSCCGALALGMRAQ